MVACEQANKAERQQRSKEWVQRLTGVHDETEARREDAHKHGGQVGSVHRREVRAHQVQQR